MLSLESCILVAIHFRVRQLGKYDVGEVDVLDRSNFQSRGYFLLVQWSRLPWHLRTAQISVPSFSRKKDATSSGCRYKVSDTTQNMKSSLLIHLTHILGTQQTDRFDSVRLLT